MQNEDWEHLSRQERGLIQAEREYMERQMMQQIWEEEQKQAKIIQDDTSEEIWQDIEPGPGPEHGDAATIRIGGDRSGEPHEGVQQGDILDANTGEKQVRDKD